MLMLMYVNISAQNFTGQTNEVILNYKNPATLTTVLPVISWITPRIEYSHSQGNAVQVEAEVRSENPIQSIVLRLINGDNQTAEKKLPVESRVLAQKVTQSIKLPDGNNMIEIVVETANGGKVSSTRYVLVGKDAIANAVDAGRSDVALIFATNSYDDLNDLVNPIDDAKEIERILKEKYGFKTELVLDPTHEEIYEKISEYNTKTFKPQDQLFVFFAGHGVFDETLSEGFVAARDSRLKDPGRSTYIPHSILRQRLDNIKCEHIFLTMDVCFGGTLDPTFDKVRAQDAYEEASESDILVRKLSQRTRKFLTSGSKEYVSDGVEGKHSPFAALFIQALKETGGKNGRIMTLYDLYPYFQKLKTETRFGKFSEKDGSTSDFVFVSKH